MMEIQEAIERIENHRGIHKLHEPRAIFISQALDMAVAALREQAERENGCEFYGPKKR